MLSDINYARYRQSAFTFMAVTIGGKELVLNMRKCIGLVKKTVKT